MSPRRTRSHVVSPNPPLLEERDRFETRRPHQDRGKRSAREVPAQESFVTRDQFEAVAQQLAVLTRFVQNLQNPAGEATSRPPLGAVPPPKQRHEDHPPQELSQGRPKSGGRPAPARADARPAPELSGTGSTSRRGRVPARDRLGPQPRPVPAAEDDDIEELPVPRRIELPGATAAAEKPDTPMDPEGLGHVPIP